MALIKYCNSKIVKASTYKQLVEDNESLMKRLGSKIPEIELHPDRYIYVRNRAISSLETSSANANADAFPRDELETRFTTFISTPNTVDHIGEHVIGSVIESEFFKPEYDDKGVFAGGDFIGNVWAVDKKMIDEIGKEHYNVSSLADLILSGEITDTSMGAIVEQSECNFCHNFAADESEYCEHLKNSKGTKIKTASGEEKDVYEICHGVTFFEDSLIIPFKYGGKSGGQGADSKAKLLERLASIKNTKIEDMLMRFYSSLNNDKKEEFEKIMDSIIS